MKFQEEDEALRQNRSKSWLRTDKEILSVGVFVNAAPELPISLLRDGTLWAAQLHGDEDEDYIEKSRI